MPPRRRSTAAELAMVPVGLAMAAGFFFLVIPALVFREWCRDGLKR